MYSQPILAFSRAMSGLRRARDEGERRVAGVQMGGVGDLVGDHRAAAAGMVGPAEHAGLVESAVDNQLAPAVEQVEQARFAVRTFELIGLLDRQPWHPPALGRKGIAGAGMAFSLTSSCCHAPSHSSADTIGGVCIPCSAPLWPFSDDVVMVHKLH